MGQPKLALPWGYRTVIEHVIEKLLKAGVEVVLVVTGPHVPEVSHLATQAGATVHVLPQATPDMRSTVEAGLNYLQDRFQPKPHDPWLLAPADHPDFSLMTVARLLQAGEDDGRLGIAVPVYQGQRGHPTLFRWRHVNGIMKLPYDLGINAFLHLQSQEIFEVFVTDAGIHLNLDTPEDYASILHSHTNQPG